MISIKSKAVVLCASLLLSSTSLMASNSDGKQILKDSYSYMGSLKQYEVNVIVTKDIFEDSQHIITKRVSNAEINRPNQFRVNTKGKHIDRTSYLSKGQFTMIDNSEKYYATVKSNKSIDQTLATISKKQGIVLPISTLMYSDMNNYIKPKHVSTFGLVDVAGVSCNYIAFKDRKTIVHLWIENSKTPLIRAIKIVTHRKDFNSNTDMIVEWNTKPTFSNDIFEFTAPKGASHISLKTSLDISGCRTAE